MEDDTMYESDTVHTSLEEEAMEDMEEKLEHLEEFDNEMQLELLYHEINHILIHGIQPTEHWYETRAQYIYTYQSLGWKDLAEIGRAHV